MSLTDLCIELRPNLRSGIAFLQFDRNLTDDLRKTRVIIKEHNVHIAKQENGDNGNNGTLVIQQNCFGMDIHGISIFTVNGNHMSFRFNYTKIDLNALEENTLEVDMKPLIMACHENETFSLICHNCENELAPSTNYSRLREFPTCVVDPSDFFCHNHGSASEEKSHPDSLLVPALRDLFYGLNFIVINISKIKGISIRNGHLYCRRCLDMVGNTVLNGMAVKLWADSVDYLPATSNVTQGRNLFLQSSMTHLMKRLLHILWPQSFAPMCPTTNRALLVTTMPNRQQHSILIHVVDSQLRVLRRIKPDHPDLQCYYACKMYYGISGPCHQKPAVLDHWQFEQTLPQMEISPKMFYNLQYQLNRNSRLIPYAWRFNTAEEKLVLSYFFYLDESTDKGNEQEHKKIKPGEQQEQYKTRLHVEYETDAGHASQESDDEHSDTDSGDHCSAAAISMPTKLIQPNIIARRSPSPSVSDSN